MKSFRDNPDGPENTEATRQIQREVFAAKMQQKKETVETRLPEAAVISVIETLDDLIRACGSGMNWMEQVSRARLSSATRGILHCDMGMTSSAIFKARRLSELLKAHLEETGNRIDAEP